MMPREARKGLDTKKPQPFQVEAFKSGSGGWDRTNDIQPRIRVDFSGRMTRTTFAALPTELPPQCYFVPRTRIERVYPRCQRGALPLS